MEKANMINQTQTHIINLEKIDEAQLSRTHTHSSKTHQEDWSPHNMQVIQVA